MSRDRWDELVRGEACPACAEVTGAGQDNREGYFVADLRVSRLRLQRERVGQARAQRRCAPFPMELCRSRLANAVVLDDCCRCVGWGNVGHVQTQVPAERSW